MTRVSATPNSPETTQPTLLKFSKFSFPTCLSFVTDPGMSGTARVYPAARTHLLPDPNSASFGGSLGGWGSVVTGKSLSPSADSWVSPRSLLNATRLGKHVSAYTLGLEPN